MSLTSLADLLEWRQGRRVAFTNGVFDVLHAGHVTYLAQARSFGDVLVVGLNTDESVRRLGKAPNRPVNTLDDRATVLAALRVVDRVVAFDEDTPERLIEALRPEVHVKGGDYTEADLPEARIVRAYGGDVRIVPLLEGRSTTAILGRLAASPPEG